MANLQKSLVEMCIKYAWKFMTTRYLYFFAFNDLYDELMTWGFEG